MGETIRTRVIYALTEPDTGEVRCIGQTGYPWRRYAHHLLRARGTPAKAAWLDSLQQRGLGPGVRVLEEVPAEEADAREDWWIEEYVRQGAALVNGPRQH